MTKHVLGSCAVALGLILAAPAWAQSQPTPELQQLDDQLPGTLINDPTRLDWSFYGATYKNKVIKSGSIPGGGAAIQVAISSKGANAYDVGASVPLAAAYVKGRTYTVAFWARTMSTAAADGKGRINVTFQQGTDPFPGFGSKQVELSDEWKLYEITATADRDIAKSAAIISYHFAAEKQTLEIGQTIVVEGADSITGKSSAAAAPAAVDRKLPPQMEGKGTVLNDYADRNWASYGEFSTAKPTTTNVYGRVATLFAVSKPGANVYDAGTSMPVREAIAKGDSLLIAVLARTVKALTPDGKGSVHVRIQKGAEPYPGFADKDLAIDSTGWKLYQFRATADADYPAGTTQIAVQFGKAEQEIEVGPIYLIRETAAGQ